MRSFWSAPALLPLVWIAACSATPPPDTPPATTATASAAPVATAAPTKTAIATAAPSATSAPVASAAPAEDPPAGGSEPAPLTEAEQKEADRSCKPLMNAVQAAKGSGKSPLEALEGALAKPPAALKPADVARCRDLLTRGIQTYLTAAKEVEAKVVLARIGRGIAAAYSDTGKLCPSSEHPVPADKALVAKDPYVSSAADWSTPAWKCTGFDFTGQPQRFQYEVRADEAAKVFVVIARGTPAGNGHWVELRQNGKIGERSVELGAVLRR